MSFPRQTPSFTADWLKHHLDAHGVYSSQHVLDDPDSADPSNPDQIVIMLIGDVGCLATALFRGRMVAGGVMGETEAETYGVGSLAALLEELGLPAAPPAVEAAA